VPVVGLGDKRLEEVDDSCVVADVLVVVVGSALDGVPGALADVVVGGLVRATCVVDVDNAVEVGSTLRSGTAGAAPWPAPSGPLVGTDTLVASAPATPDVRSGIWMMPI
jgi:hypothetical protein